MNRIDFLLYRLPEFKKNSDCTISSGLEPLTPLGKKYLLKTWLTRKTRRRPWRIKDRKHQPREGPRAGAVRGSGQRSKEAPPPGLEGHHKTTAERRREKPPPPPWCSAHHTPRTASGPSGAASPLHGGKAHAVLQAGQVLRRANGQPGLP